MFIYVPLILLWSSQFWSPHWTLPNPKGLWNRSVHQVQKNWFLLLQLHPKLEKWLHLFFLRMLSMIPLKESFHLMASAAIVFQVSSPGETQIGGDLTHLCWWLDQRLGLTVFQYYCLYYFFVDFNHTWTHLQLLEERDEAMKQEELPSIDDDCNQLEVSDYVDEIYQYYWVSEVMVMMSL